ncbi:MAG: hypothetical protein JXP73_14020 [Deltaproteobacteria bacterium]|nr:hypothetical protein [Deltaproteobacteria bacterium]
MSLGGLLGTCRRGVARAWRGHPGLPLFAAVACLYFASMSREVPWGDARPVYEVALSMVRGDGVSVQTRWPDDASPGRGGKFYAAQPWLPSLTHVPGAIVRTTLGRLVSAPESLHLLDVFSCHLAGGLLGALCAWLFFRLCLRHGASRRVARFGAILLGAGSIVWVYARYPFTEIVQAACFTGFFMEAAQLAKRLDRRTAVAAGLWAGALLNTKYVCALCLPGAFVVVALAHRRTPRQLGRSLLHAAWGFLPFVLMLLAYNYLRFGSVTNTGYRKVGEVMVENVFLSTWGFLFSPGKSVFLYAPPLVLAALGLRRFWQEQRTSVLLMLATIVPLVLFYGRFPSWPGDWAWGPRYLVFAVPVLLLPVIGFLPHVRWPGRGLAVLGLALGIFVQMLGNAFYWDHYLRIALDVRTKWLGQPNRGASLTVDKGGYCEGCFEDIYPTVWLAPLQPILGHLWLLRHVPFGDTWQQASADAPWRRHTHLPLDIQATYRRVRMDHWLYDTHAHRFAGWVVFLLLLGGGTVSLAVFIRRTRDDGD